MQRTKCKCGNTRVRFVFPPFRSFFLFDVTVFRMCDVVPGVSVVLQRVAVRGSVLQCVAVCYVRSISCVAACCSVLQCAIVCAECCRVLQCLAVSCSSYSVLQSVAVCCSMLQCDVGGLRIERLAHGTLQCAAVCCSVLHCDVACEL